MVYGPWSIMSHAWLTENPYWTVPPKGGTLTATGMAGAPAFGVRRLDAAFPVGNQKRANVQLPHHHSTSP